MTYKQRETAREIRLWIGQVIVPGIVAGAAILKIFPETKEKFAAKVNDIKKSIKNR